MTKTRFVGPFSLLILGCMAADGLHPAEVQTIYDRAMAEFRSGDYPGALAELKHVDDLTAAPAVKAELLNLRGVILMRQCEYEGAELVLQRALDLNPHLWNAGFNLAEIPFLKKEWFAAQNRFEAMLARDDGTMDVETRQLIRYKTLLTLVLQGKNKDAEATLNQLDSSPSEPTSYYVRAAIAWREGRSDEASEWQRKAEGEFSPAINKLYAESFYEIGWQQKPTGASREIFNIASPGERSALAQAHVQETLAQAESAFLAHQTERAFALLDEVDKRAPGLAASHNLRGEILLGEDKFDEAETEFNQAAADDPNLHEAAYNLAEVAFRKKDYTVARGRLERLFTVTPGGENQAAQLMKFKIFLTFLLEGREDRAEQLKNQFKFTDVTPALYYAEAAWDFQHANRDHGNDWIESARKIYSPELNMIFSSSFYELGWLDKPVSGRVELISTPPIDETLVPSSFSASVSLSLTNWQVPLLSMNKGMAEPLNDPPQIPDSPRLPGAPDEKFLPEIVPP